MKGITLLASSSCLDNNQIATKRVVSMRVTETNIHIMSLQDNQIIDCVTVTDVEEAVLLFHKFQSKFLGKITDIVSVDKINNLREEM